jgi:hypothetical protein
MIWLGAGGEEIVFWLDPNNGLPMVDGQPGGALPIMNVWYYYELVLDRAALKVKLYINNKFDSEFPISAAVAAASLVDVGFGYRHPNTYKPAPNPDDLSAKTVDDMYINDGPKLNPIIVTTRFPSTDQISEWFSTDLPHASAVSRRPPEPLDHFIASDTFGDTDEFKSNTMLVTGNEIVATGVNVLARKAPSLNARLGLHLGGTPGAALRQGVVTVESEYRQQYLCFNKVVGDTKTGIESAPFGVTITN